MTGGGGGAFNSWELKRGKGNVKVGWEGNKEAKVGILRWMWWGPEGGCDAGASQGRKVRCEEK